MRQFAERLLIEGSFLGDRVPPPQHLGQHLLHLVGLGWGEDLCFSQLTAVPEFRSVNPAVCSASTQGVRANPEVARQTQVAGLSGLGGVGGDESYCLKQTRSRGVLFICDKHFESIRQDDDAAAAWRVACD